MVQIITDSSTLYTEQEAQRSGFEAVPLCISIGDYHDRDLQVDMEEYYRKIADGHIPLSSQPPIGDVVDCYEKYAGSEIINISMADGLSGTYQSACSAREMVDHKDQITVFNSRTLCGPHRYMVEMAQKLKEEGKNASEILEWLRQKADQTESFLIPQDFSFLKRGGRLTPVAAALGSVLKLKPIMCLTRDGKRLDKFAVKRTMTAAVKCILDYLKEKELSPASVSRRHALPLLLFRVRIHPLPEDISDSLRRALADAIRPCSLSILSVCSACASPVF